MDIEFQDISFDEQCKKLDMFLQAHKDEIAKMVKSNSTCFLHQSRQAWRAWGRASWPRAAVGARLAGATAVCGLNNPISES